eukprot:TRINITY_DN2463_c0_g1_i1.p1 TRINITY_DN2463_c0_g1~~TRINITY_DN2463_c0_g1_i1.p1  ORF type:complete len:248 (-),score=58.26 TRINITY_DN2463_c0_g1_i1:58-801(-)
MSSSPLGSEVSSSPVNDHGVYSNSDSLEVYLRAQQEFENQLIQAVKELTSNGIDIATAEYEILCRLSVVGGSIVVEEEALEKYMIDGRLRRDEAVRALVIQRELDSLREKGCTLLDSITELILRLNNKGSAAVGGGGGVVKRMSSQLPPQQQQQQQQQQLVMKKKKIRELSTLCVVSKNKVRVHRRQDSTTGDDAGKEAYMYDGESPRPAKKLRKDGGGQVVELAEQRKRMRSKGTYKTTGSGKFSQ